jgi:membrane-associated phospholipid phosphatase
MNNILSELILIIFTTYILTLVVKNITKIPRPQNAIIKLCDYAFPSGHTSLSFAVAAFYTELILNLKIELIEKILLIGVIFLGVILVVYWRLQIKVHTPFQIFAGAAFGFLIASVVMILL